MPQCSRFPAIPARFGPVSALPAPKKVAAGANGVRYTGVSRARNDRETGMASQQGTVDFLLDQLAGAGGVSAKKMFGEYGLYCDGKMFAIVADDMLLIKPTEVGRAWITAQGALQEAPPYRKPSRISSSTADCGTNATGSASWRGARRMPCRCRNRSRRPSQSQSPICKVDIPAGD